MINTFFAQSNQLSEEEITLYCQSNNLEGFHPIARDGNCFFRAVLVALGENEEQHVQLRTEIIANIRKNEQDFLQFFENREAFLQFTERLSQPGTWAEDIILNAVAKFKNCTITIIDLQKENNNILNIPYTISWQDTIALHTITLIRVNNNHYHVLNHHNPLDKKSETKEECFSPVQQDKPKDGTLILAPSKQVFFNSDLKVPTPFDSFLDDIKNHKLSPIQIEKIYQNHPYYQNSFSSKGKTPWHVITTQDSRYLEYFNILHTFIGHQINEPDKLGFSPLHYSVLQGDLCKCEYLLSHGADRLNKDNLGNTFLHLAAQKNKIDFIKTFYQKRDSILINNHGVSILDMFLLANPLLRIISHFSGEGANISQLEERDFHGVYDIFSVYKFENNPEQYKSDSLHHFMEFKSEYLPYLNEQFTGYVSWIENEKDNLYYKKNKNEKWQPITIEDGNLWNFYKLMQSYLLKEGIFSMNPEAQNALLQIIDPENSLQLTDKQFFSPDDHFKILPHLPKHIKELLQFYNDKELKIHASFAKQYKIQGQKYTFYSHNIDGHLYDMFSCIVANNFSKKIFAYLAEKHYPHEIINYFHGLPVHLFKDSIDAQGNNVLHYTVNNRNLDELTIYFLKNGVSPALKNKEGLTPFSMLVKSAPQWQELVQFFRWSLVQESNQSSRLLAAAQQYSSENSLDEIIPTNFYLELGFVSHNQSLVPFNSHGLIKFMHEVLELSPLSQEIIQTRASLIEEFEQCVDLMGTGDVDLEGTLILLINNFSDINFKDEKNNTLLHHAVKKKDLTIIGTILKRSPIFSKNDEGKTPWLLFEFRDREEAYGYLEVLLKTSIELSSQSLMENLLEYAAQFNVYPEQLPLLDWIVTVINTENSLANIQDTVKLTFWLFYRTRAILHWVNSNTQLSLPSYDEHIYSEISPFRQVIVKGFLYTLANSILSSQEKMNALTFLLHYLGDHRSGNPLSHQKNYFLALPDRDLRTDGLSAFQLLADLDPSLVSIIFAKFPPQNWYGDYTSQEIYLLFANELTLLMKSNPKSCHLYLNTLSKWEFFKPVIELIQAKIQKESDSPINSEDTEIPEEIPKKTPSFSFFETTSLEQPEIGAISKNTFN